MSEEQSRGHERWCGAQTVDGACVRCDGAWGDAASAALEEEMRAYDAKLEAFVAGGPDDAPPREENPYFKRRRLEQEEMWSKTGAMTVERAKRIVQIFRRYGCSVRFEPIGPEAPDAVRLVTVEEIADRAERVKRLTDVVISVEASVADVDATTSEVAFCPIHGAVLVDRRCIPCAMAEAGGVAFDSLTAEQKAAAIEWATGGAFVLPDGE